MLGWKKHKLESRLPGEISVTSDMQMTPPLWKKAKIMASGPTAAAAKSLQSCPTLCDTIDGSPPGSPIPGILQARVLEWVAISFSNAAKQKVKAKSPSCVWLLETPWTAATRVLHPWDFPCKSTGVGCHCLLCWSYYFMANRWENNGNSDQLYFRGSKITADGDCSHEIERCLLLGRKVMTNLDSILKSRGITLPTKVQLVKLWFFQ